MSGAGFTSARGSDVDGATGETSVTLSNLRPIVSGVDRRTPHQRWPVGAGGLTHADGERGLDPRARRILDEAGRVGIDVVASCPGDRPETLTPRVRRFQLLVEVLATAYYALPPTLTAGRRTPLHSVRRRVGQYLIRHEE